MIARKSALIITTNLIDGLLAYVALFFISRYMSPEEYGIVAFALGFVAIFSILGQLGFNSAHVKKISEGKNLGKCVGTFLASKILFTGLMTLLVITAILFWKIVMGRGFETPEHELAIYIIMGHWIVKLLGNTFDFTYKGRKEIAKVQIAYLSGVIVRVGVTIYVAYFGYGALALAFTHIAGEIIHLIVLLLFFRGYSLDKPSFHYFKEYFTFAFPLIIVSASSLIMTNIDKLLIQLFWSSSDVGYYFAAFRLSAFINMFTLAIGTLLFPTFSSLHTNKDITGIRSLIFRSERYLSMIVFPMVLGLVTLAQPTVNILLSRGWTESIPVLQILPFFVLFAALEKPYQSQFLGMNKPKLARDRILIMVCINIVLNIILIPKDIQMFGINLFGLGGTGAAIATVVAYGIGLIYSRAIAWRANRIKGNQKIFLHALAASIMAIILHIILYEIYSPGLIARWYHLVGFSFLGLGIYLGILIILREFTKDDFRFFLDTLNIKKMYQYIKNEIKR